MKMQKLNIISAILIVLGMLACDSKPRVIESKSSNAEASRSGIFKDVATARDANSEEHKVVVEEALNTEKYTYLKVSEKGEEFWIAIPRKEVKIGDTYYYKGGLLKKNFASREYNRVFEKVYLVANIWKQPGGNRSSLDETLSKMEGGGALPDLKVGKIAPAPGGIKIADLVDNKEKYAGKVVKVTGKCVKVNPMIMHRNWIHLQDGSGDNLDLTVTTAENIALGAVVTMEGTIALDKDFGAGYYYDIIMEGAVLK